ncbi:hypothetical protein P389DRAFT_82729 [Cystobasidium minutum MCA 4210]|uniref:uncharacterized protein n=1 Tax=Cystobasidium minutum MCA 4210 TaxID=1397322 RepID=UPI0034CF58E0|eukprot:jgi/Rhomi1/82729/CE82728_3669
MNSSTLSKSPETIQDSFPTSLSSKESEALTTIEQVKPASNGINNSKPATVSPAQPRTRTPSHTSLLRSSTSSLPSSHPDKMLGLKASLALPKSTSSRSASPAGTPTTSHEGQQRSNGSSANTNGHYGGMHISLPKVRSKSGDGNKRTASNGGGLPTPSDPGMMSPILSAGGTLSPAPSTGHGGTSSLKQLSSLLSGRSHGAATPSAGAAAGAVPTPPLAHHHSSQTPTTAGHGSNISGLEASYVTKVGMSLNDAVNKVFPSPATAISTAAAGYSTISNDSALITYKGLCAPRVDRARDVGTMIAHELHLAVNDQYLLRSLLRSAVLKTLSIFMSRLESLIISQTSDPSVLFVPRTVKEAENPPPSQRFSFLILRSAWELKKGLNKACSGVTVDAQGGPIIDMPKFVKDTLGPWINKLDLLVNRIWGPIIAAIKDEAVMCITVQGALECGLTQPATMPSPAIGSLALPAPHPASSGRSLSLSRSSTPTPTPVPGTMGSSAALSVPNYLKDLSTLLAATSRTFAWLSVAEIDQANWKVAIGSSIIWKMMMMCSFRRVDDVPAGSYPSRRASPPPSTVHAFTSVNGATTPSALSGGQSTPILEAPTAAAAPKRSMSAMGIARLRGAATSHNGGKRSPSPPRANGAGGRAGSLAATNAARLVVDVEIFEACVEKFVSSLSLVAPTASFDESNPNSRHCSKNKDCPICKGRFIPVEVEDSDDEDELPREAMQEAMTALSSFIVVLRFFAHESSNPVPKLLRAIQAVDDLSLAPELCPNFIRALDLLPPLILLQTLVARIPSYYEFRMPNQLWNTSWKQYETTMKGFHTGEEWVAEVGWELLKEARRVGKRMTADQRTGLANGAASARSAAEKVATMQIKEEVKEKEGVDEAAAANGDEEGWLNLLKLAIVELGEVDDLEEEGYASASSISLRGVGGIQNGH